MLCLSARHWTALEETIGLFDSKQAKEVILIVGAGKPCPPPLEPIGDFISKEELDLLQEAMANADILTAFSVLDCCLLLRRQKDGVHYTVEEFRSLEKCLELGKVENCAKLVRFYEKHEETWAFAHIVFRIFSRIASGCP
ncbi:MAG: hypothetical protein KGH93_01730 [Patescibacteria group bacterium]|nr:hypothetical protein [Patescibacteria group bacterium]MDE1945897.1 hypothetical protein [Patescibacteria group bacterium]